MVESVIQIAREAAQFMKADDFSVENKGGIGNDVTTADKNVQEYVKKSLQALDSAIGFIGEEKDEQDYQSRRVWVVDPIDGTANFIRGLGASAISIGLVEDGEAVLGVVYNPYRDEMFWAVKGKGAYCNGKRLSVSDRDFSHGIYCTAFCLYKKEFGELCENIMRDVYGVCKDFRRFGTAAIELSALAAGRVELYFEMRLYPWDYAASTILIREAGGFIGTIPREDGAELIFNRPVPVIAANSRENYEKLENIIKKWVPTVPYVD